MKKKQISTITARIYEINKWTVDNNLYINSRKIEVVVFSTPHMGKADIGNIINHDGESLKRKMNGTCSWAVGDTVDEHNYLGVVFDKHLKFNNI